MFYNKNDTIILCKKDTVIGIWGVFYEIYPLWS